MLSLVLVTEAEETQRFITMLIIALLVFGGLLFLLTFWYWRSTNPKRRVRRVLQPAGGGGELDLRRPQQGYPQQGYPQQGYPPHPGYDPRSADQRGYDPRYASPGRGGDQRYVAPGARDPYAGSQAESTRRRLLQDDRDPYGYGRQAAQPGDPYGADRYPPTRRP